MRTRASTLELVSGSTSSSGLDLGDHERLGLDEADQADALHAFGKDEPALVGHAHHFMHRGQGADRVHVVGGGRVQAGVLLGGDDDGALFAQGLDELDGAFAADGKWQNGMGKQDGVPHRQDGDSPQVGGGLGGIGRRNGMLVGH